MKLDRIEGKPDDKVAWGSDIAAQMLRRFGIPFISLNPGASYRGFHDSLVNHLGKRTLIILCLHEDRSVDSTAMPRPPASRWLRAAYWQCRSARDDGLFNAGDPHR
jgi:hypothetical protein